MQSRRVHPLTKPLNVCLLAAVSCLLWGSAAPAIKTGYRLYSIAENETLKILLFAGMRFALAGAMVILFTSLTTRRFALPKKESWRGVCMLGLFQTVGQYIFYYVGVANSSGVHTAILSGASNLFAILMACFLFRQEKMTPPKLLGCLLGFGGILAMNIGGGEGGKMTLVGEGFVLFSGVSSGIASCLSKNYSRTEDPSVLTGWQFLLGGLFMCACALAGGARLSISSPAAAGVLAYLGFLSAMAYTLWTILIKYNSVSSVAVYGFMNPLFGLLLSALLLGEVSQAFSPGALAALVLVCAGIIAVNRYGNSTKCHK